MPHRVPVNRALVTYLKHLASLELTNVTVEHYHRFARGYLTSIGKMGRNVITRPNKRTAYMAAAITNVAVSNPGHPLMPKSSRFIAEEIRWIARQGCQTLREYEPSSVSQRGTRRPVGMTFISAATGARPAMRRFGATYPERLRDSGRRDPRPNNEQTAPACPAGKARKRIALLVGLLRNPNRPE